MLDLTVEELTRLRNLNNDKGTIFALKKLFLNTIIKGEPSLNADTRAAERTAIEFIKKTFHELSVISPKEQERNQTDNIF